MFAAALFINALLINAAVATDPRTDTTPMDRVITLLKNLRSKVDSEGAAEAATYDKFACWCKDTMASKATAISEGETERDSLEAKINAATLARDTADQGIDSESAAASGVEGEIEENTETTHAQNEDISKDLMDITKALQGLDAAIQALSAAQTANAFVQVNSVPKAVRAAFALVQVLGTQDQSAMKVINALAQDPDTIGGSVDNIPVPADYAFHASDVIDTLKGLKTEFAKKKGELVQSAADLQTAHESFVQDKKTALATHKAAVETHKANLKVESETIATASQDLTTTSAELLDDQATLTAVSAKCNEKAQLWDKRVQTRANEITAITQALTEIEAFRASDGTVTTGLMQTKRTMSTVHVALSKHFDAPAFVQLASNSQRIVRHLRGQSPAAVPVVLDEKQSEIVDLLRMKAETFKSALLLKAATEVSEDPFAKVKGLIQDLITRLLKEQNDEANHKGWCDKEVGVATTKRDNNAKALEEVNTKMATGEAHRAKLRSQVAKLDDEIKTIQTQLANATKLRSDESAENTELVKLSKQGLAAVEKAIDILDKFYKAAAKGKAFVQRNGTQPEPDAGFDDHYIGAQDAKEGVVGMLEVLAGDFKRAIAETEHAEKESAQEFLQLETTLGKSNATQTVAHADRTRALGEADAEYAEDQTNMAAHVKGRDSALQQLKALHGPCLASGGTSPEEKKAQREEELSSLNQALCILDQHGREGIEC